MLNVQTFTFNPFQENCYILYDDTKTAVIIDPGCYAKEEQETLKAFIDSNGLKPVRLLNTHCHIDHVLGNYFINHTYGLSLEIHPKDEPVLAAVGTYASNYGFPGYTACEAEKFLEEGDKISFGNTELEVIWVPGHAPGHVVFYHPESKTCIGGDTLFQGSIGRTDLPGGDHQTLLDAIKSKLFSLPDDVKVYPGHGPATLIGHEKNHNPFVGKNAQF
ncbi:MBL fold metallo-hydrolase [Echinicola strongylocentroti]|uniref:MBL fold metallo-hydrolase n=1 Tax=Echinicola strongylocentroti TaxID=1795355 RepID=A0A2Z4INB1_9BACT|nr:MBL fold metallo-hydrolase [Echinicola strongylocentroti]AWW32324.1 MBL fold metallo-hydrolase [Echinicola strongylocentroti]